MKDTSVFLKHILESIELIERYTDGISEDEFLNSVEKQDLVMRRLEIIGEAVRNIPVEFTEKHPAIEWKKAMAVRNILIHHYFGVDLEIIWDTVSVSLPKFKKQVQDLLSPES
jgi:uncharacterized protein with HEPN domain